MPPSLRPLTILIVATAIALPAHAVRKDFFGSLPDLGLAIPDDAYDGSRASMTCSTIAVAAPVGEPLPQLVDVEVGLRLDHTFAGDLVIKLYGPSGTSVTLLSRPGFAEPADDGTLSGGSPANLSADVPIGFATNGNAPAESLGNGLTTSDVVGANGSASLFTSEQPLTVFAGGPFAGDWSLCLGDAGGIDLGTLQAWTLVLASADDTVLQLLPDAFGDPRFDVAMRWRASGGDFAPARGVQLTPEGGYFYFTNPDNIEVVVKLKDGCPVNERTWVFLAGLTNVEVELTVTERISSLQRKYTNPERTVFQTVLDTQAFSLCPGPI